MGAEWLSNNAKGVCNDHKKVWKGCGRNVEGDRQAQKGCRMGTKGTQMVAEECGMDVNQHGIGVEKGSEWVQMSMEGPWNKLGWTQKDTEGMLSDHGRLCWA